MTPGVMKGFQRNSIKEWGEADLEAVVVLPEGHTEVPSVHNGNAQFLHHRQRHPVAPATLQNYLHIH